MDTAVEAAAEAVEAADEAEEAADEAAVEAVCEVLFDAPVPEAAADALTEDAVCALEEALIEDPVDAPVDTEEVSDDVLDEDIPEETAAEDSNEEAAPEADVPAVEAVKELFAEDAPVEAVPPSPPVVTLPLPFTAEASCMGSMGSKTTRGFSELEDWETLRTDSPAEPSAALPFSPDHRAHRRNRPAQHNRKAPSRRSCPVPWLSP